MRYAHNLETLDDINPKAGGVGCCLCGFIFLLGAAMGWGWLIFAILSKIF